MIKKPKKLYISIKAVAEYLELAPLQVIYLLARRDIKGTCKRGSVPAHDRWKIEADSVNKYKNSLDL